jgi:hypothetical protein
MATQKRSVAVVELSADQEAFAQRLGMEMYFAALTQSLATFAPNTRDFVGAAVLYRRLAEHRCA